jgi:hypothetical protein
MSLVLTQGARNGTARSLTSGLRLPRLGRLFGSWARGRACVAARGPRASGTEGSVTAVSSATVYPGAPSTEGRKGLRADSGPGAGSPGLPSSSGSRAPLSALEAVCGGHEAGLCAWMLAQLRKLCDKTSSGPSYCGMYFLEKGGAFFGGSNHMFWGPVLLTL